MAKYKSPDGSVIEVGDASLNPDLVKGRTLVGDDTALAGASMLSPIQRTVIEPNADAAQSFLERPFKTPETAAQIAERKRTEARAQIDAIEQGFQEKKEEKEKLGQERIARDNAASVLAGLTGSSVADHSRGQVLEANDKEIQALIQKKALDLLSLESQISKDAQSEAQQQIEDATRNAEAVVARRKDVQMKAQETIKQMASGGLVDFDVFKSNPRNAQVYQHALDAYGGSEDALRAAFMLNRPQDQLVGTPVRMGNMYVQAYKNPITGKIKYESIDMPADLPPEYNTFQKLGDNLVAIPEGWDGDTSKLRTIVGAPSTMERLQQQSIALDIAKKQKDLNAPASTNNLTETEVRQTRDRVAAGKQLLTLAEQYKNLIEKNGFTNTTAGNQEVVGEIKSLRAQMTAAYKDAKTLGTLDTGVLTLMESVLGEEPTSTWNPLANISGNRSKRITSQISSLINTTKGEIAKNEERLGQSPTAAAASQHPDLKPGEILVKDKASGQLGAIPENEFNEQLYERQ